MAGVAMASVGVEEVLHQYTPVPEFANSLIDWLIALGVAAAWLLALFAIRRLIRRLNRRLEETEPELSLPEVFTATFSRTTLVFIIVSAAAAGLATLNPSGLVTRVARTAVMIALIWQVGIWSTAATSALLERRRQQALDRAMAGSLSIVGVIVRTAIWIIVVLVILQNAGVDVGALMAGLGIGGVAVALAVQNVLSDLFASLSITLDQPFVVGDLLILENLEGNVEHIGLKSTRIRSLGGEQIIVSNADLLRSRVRNFGRMSERRVEFNLAIAYETGPDTLERIPAIIKEIVTSESPTRFERSHLAGHGVYALNFVTVYYVLSPDFERHVDIQHRVHVRIHREFARTGIKFAEALPWLPAASGPRKS